jgi:hypothetical protein
METNKFNYLNVALTRSTDKTDNGIHRKQTFTDIIINNHSDHSAEHKHGAMLGPQQNKTSPS